MYDISNRESFDHLTKWLDLIKDAINDIPIVLVGNKIDKEEERLVSYNEGEQLAKELNISFFESSGKENKNVKEPFYSLCEEIINKMKNERTSTNNFSINNQKEKEKKKKCCKNF